MSQFKYFGHLGSVEDPLSFFQEQNYIICRGATELVKIDDLVSFYNQSIINSPKQYLRQSTNWEHHQKTSAGGIANPFLNPHCLEKGVNAQFSDKILRVLSSRKIQESLAEISGKTPNFQLFQTMIFDHSTTGPHQDWIFLDSRPNGHLIAAWVALENIYPEGIRFYVYPGTHQFIPQAKYNNINTKKNQDIYANFNKEINDLLKSKKFQMYAPPLQKGDIFFWGSRIIHGSTTGTNPNLRRRSIAAHFVPDGFGIGNLEIDFKLPFKEKYGLIYVDYSLDKIFENINNCLSAS